MLDKTESLLERFETRDTELYTDRDIQVFVECLMSGGISPKYVAKCIIAIALYLDLDREEYEEQTQEEDEYGDVDTYKTSEFNEFTEISLVYLATGKTSLEWLRSFKELLLRLERYELLHVLELESRYKV